MVIVCAPMIGDRLVIGPGGTIRITSVVRLTCIKLDQQLAPGMVRAIRRIRNPGSADRLI
ncbi:hypothetical protein [Bradyrhizobium sp. USDA 313]|uniref:hypothetical protein n=1 Tax=Bradyrhizobium sp. USDA 313 TaxID=3156307 RepID=UPI0035130777